MLWTVRPVQFDGNPTLGLIWKKQRLHLDLEGSPRLWE